jgi:hypothetical protein
MTDHILDLPEFERKARRYRQFRRLRLVLSVLLPLVMAAGIGLVYMSIDYRDTVSSAGPFDGWNAQHFFYFLVSIVEPAVALVIASVLALVPIKRTRYYQRITVLFLLLAVVIGAVEIRQLIVEAWWNK